MKKRNKKMNVLTPYQMCDAVNKFDKEHGIKLKHPSVWDEPEKFLLIYQARSEMNIGGIICILNGIDVSDYSESDETYGMIQKPIGIMHASFVEDSCLDWNGNKTFRTNSIKFKCRFLTLLLFQFIGNIDKAINGAWKTGKQTYYYHSKAEQQIMINKKIIDYAVLLVNLMLNNMTYTNTILKINELINYTRKKNQSEFLKEFLGNTLGLIKGINNDPLTGVFMDEDIAIHTIIKVAYMLATNKKDIKRLPTFAELENSAYKYDLKNVFIELGKCIKRASKTKKQLSPMFRAFIEARPEIWTPYELNDENLNLGIATLDFTSFVLNNKNVTEAINKMKRKGK